MNRPLVREHMTASLSGPNHRAEWSAVLIQHHRDIHHEIERVQAMVDRPGCHLHMIEARLRRLGQAVLMHLELESCFLDPAVQAHSGPGGEDLQRLRAGYDELRHALESTADFLQREKLSHATPVLSDEQRRAIAGLLCGIQDQLEIENGYYRRYREAEL